MGPTCAYIPITYCSISALVSFSTALLDIVLLMLYYFSPYCYTERV